MAEVNKWMIDPNDAVMLLIDQQFPLLALKSYTTLSAAHCNSPPPVYDRLSGRLF